VAQHRRRANVYVDGFNFYYGCFANTRERAEWVRYKWLDLHSFITKVFPHYHINRIRYFTALVNPTSDDPDQRLRQLTYLRALQTIPILTIHYGRFARTAKYRWRADARSFERPYKPVPVEPIEKVAVILEEEKGSDVNLASYLLMDAFADEYDVAIVVSNDSDLALPIRLVKSELKRTVALLNPRSKTAVDLRNIADVYRSVRLGVVRDSQFPDSLTDEHGVITKPDRW
jgi:uncharacterized LabA/DUF88 family protein